MVGINQGMYSTIVREVPAYMAQFTLYEFIKREIFCPGARLGPPKSNISSLTGAGAN
jgi:hypothetical protein